MNGIISDQGFEMPKEPNAIAEYVDAETGKVLKRIPYYDPGLVNTTNDPRFVPGLIYLPPKIGRSK